jgi:hypothetical protein
LCEYSKVKENKMTTALEHLPATILELEEQLALDEERWGKDEWLVHTLEEQESRIFDRFEDYYEEYVRDGTPIPWLKVMGDAHIALTRERIAG